MERISWDGLVALTSAVDIKECLFSSPEVEEDISTDCWSCYLMSLVVQFKGLQWAVVDSPFDTIYSNDKFRVQAMKRNLVCFFSEFDHVKGFERVRIVGEANPV